MRRLPLGIIDAYVIPIAMVREPTGRPPGQTRVHCPVRPLQRTPRAVRKASGNREERLRVDVIDRKHDPCTARDLVRRH